MTQSLLELGTGFHPDLSGRENIYLNGSMLGLSRAEIDAKYEDIVAFSEMADYIDMPVKHYSSGMYLRLAFSVAILHNPKIVFLDEPTSGVDPITRRQFWNLIYEASDKGITVFVTTHYMDEAEYCDRISMMVEGKIAALGSLHELLAKYNANRMDEVFIKLAR